LEYGLIGENLAHSYSKIIHEKFGLYKYNLHSVSIDEIKDILISKNFKALNVTIPFKKTVIPYCDKLSSTAEKIGSVNTLIVDENNQLCGDNTDYYGLKYTIERSNIVLKNKKVIILGNGGTSVTAKTLSQDLGAKEIITVSRSERVNYKNIYEHYDADVIINTTPVGMYPNNDESLIDLNKFKNLTGVIDVIYNPFYTNLILKAKNMNIPFAGGLPMLVAQAKAFAELVTGIKLDNSIVEKTIKELVLELSNIVLIGMPGSGKTTLGGLVAEKSGKKFIDIDSEIEDSFGLTIPEIFDKYGEKEFRLIESKILKNNGKQNNLVISTGGGVVLDKNNYANIKQNGVIYWVKRNLDLLETIGRPLSKNLYELEKIYSERKSLYQTFCDRIIENNSSPNDTAGQILEDFYENTCY